MTSSAQTERARRLRGPGYFIFIIAMLLPLLDVIMSVMPFKVTSVAWRFGAFGLFASAVGAPLLVLFLIYALALTFGDRKMVILCGVVGTLLCVLLIAGFGSFALDALQMKSRVPAAAMPKFYAASSQAIVKLAVQGLASLILTVSIFRALRDPKLAAPRFERSAAANLVVGRSVAHRPIDRTDTAPRSLEGGVASRASGDSPVIVPRRDE